MRRVEHPRAAPCNLRRHTCAQCGAHVVCLVGKATLGGRCSTCGSYELVGVVEGETTLPAAAR